MVGGRDPVSFFDVFISSLPASFNDQIVPSPMYVLGTFAKFYLPSFSFHGLISEFTILFRELFYAYNLPLMKAEI
jgi:hypothetical protein